MAETDIKSTSASGDVKETNVVELLTDALVTTFEQWQESYVRRTGLSDEQVRRLIHTYLWLSTLKNGVSRAKLPGTQDSEMLSDYQEPAVISGYLEAPSLVMMSDEGDEFFTLTRDYIYDPTRVVDSIEFKQIWAKLKKSVNPRNMQLETVPVKTSQRELLDSSYPKIFKGNMADFNDDEAVKLPYLLKESVNVYGDGHFVVRAQKYYRALLHNFFERLSSPSARPEVDHLASKPVPVKDASTKKDEN